LFLTTAVLIVWFTVLNLQTTQKEITQLLSGVYCTDSTVTNEQVPRPVNSRKVHIVLTQNSGRNKMNSVQLDSPLLRDPF